MSDPRAPIDAPLKRFGLPPGDPWLVLVGEAERNAARAGRLPQMLFGYTDGARLALTRTDLSPEEVGAVEAQLLARDDVRWSATAGEIMLADGGGVLRHIFVRARWPDGRWRAAARPFLFGDGGLTWLGEWKPYSGDRPDGPFFPSPAERQVRLAVDGDQSA